MKLRRPDGARSRSPPPSRRCRRRRGSRTRSSSRCATATTSQRALARSSARTTSSSTASRARARSALAAGVAARLLAPAARGLRRAARRHAALHFVDRIEQAGRTMEKLIHDLLEFSRIGQPGEQRALVDPRAVLQQLQAELKPRLEPPASSSCCPRRPPCSLRPHPPLPDVLEPDRQRDSTTWARARRRGSSVESRRGRRDHITVSRQRPRRRAPSTASASSRCSRAVAHRRRAQRHRHRTRDRAEDREDPRRPRLGREPARHGRRVPRDLPRCR